MSGRGSSRGPRKRLGPVQGVIRAEDLLQVFDAEQQDEAHGWWKAGSSHDLHIFQRKVSVKGISFGGVVIVEGVVC